MLRKLALWILNREQIKSGAVITAYACEDTFIEVTRRPAKLEEVDNG